MWLENILIFYISWFYNKSYVHCWVIPCWTNMVSEHISSLSLRRILNEHPGRTCLWSSPCCCPVLRIWELASSYLFEIHFDTTQESMVDNFCYPPALKLCIKLGECGTIKMEVKLLVFSIFIFFSWYLNTSEPAGNYFTVDQFWHDQWQADCMPTAPSCHVSPSPVGTHFCAHCPHGREGAPPENVAFVSLPL